MLCSIVCHKAIETGLVIIHSIMQNIHLLLLFLFLGISCKEQRPNEEPLAAQQTAIKVRDRWKETEKPVTIQVEGCDLSELEQPDGFSVCTGTSQSTVRFRTKGNVLQADEAKLLAEDSTVIVRLCFPYHKELSIDDTLHLKQPFGEHLYGIEHSRINSESLKVNMELKSSLSLLRIQIASDKLQDILDELWIYGEALIGEADYLPYTGKWMNGKGNGILTSETDDCLLNNGWNHDFFLVPTNHPLPITIFAKVNKLNHAVKTTLPPVQEGSLIQLNVEVGKSGKLHITSSWVETERKIRIPNFERSDSVEVGHYLRTDGSVCKSYDSLSMAIVIETDGKHGKAVALQDAGGLYTFGSKKMNSGKLFATIDGRLREGIINPLSEDLDSEEERIVFKPGMPYPNDCALGCVTGATLTEGLVFHKNENDPVGTTAKSHTGLVMPSKKMLTLVSCHKGSYIPSLSEMARLYYLMQPYSNQKMPECFQPLEGEYLTSSESSTQTFYTMDMGGGVVNGSSSKAYSKGRVRLFYLF